MKHTVSNNSESSSVVASLPLTMNYAVGETRDDSLLLLSERRRGKGEREMDGGESLRPANIIDAAIERPK